VKEDKERSLTPSKGWDFIPESISNAKCYFEKLY
jgi:hypothetical protein